MTTNDTTTPTKEDDYEYVYYKIENEGFDYCFRDYSDFKEIHDDKFHELRKAYLKSAEELENYINEKAGIDDDNE